jgi:hypothetical protein
MAKAPRDPRSDAEKARADLMRNEAMGLGVPESPLERQPSVTPRTFGEGGDKARLLSGTDQGVEAGGEAPEAGGDGEAPSIAEAEQVAKGRDSTAPLRPDEAADEDVLSRAKE